MQTGRKMDIKQLGCLPQFYLRKPAGPQFENKIQNSHMGLLLVFNQNLPDKYDDWYSPKPAFPKRWNVNRQNVNLQNDKSPETGT